MKIYDVLHKDHEEAEALITKLEKKCADDDKDAPKLYQKIKTALTEHFNGEEKLFYSVIAQGGFQEAIQRAISQHDAVRSTLGRLDGTIQNSAQAQPLVQELKSRVVQHVQFEETEVWDDGRKVIDAKQEDRIGDEMLEAEPDVHPMRAKIAQFKEDMRT